MNIKIQYIAQSAYEVVKKTRYHLLAITLFYALTIAFFYPRFFQGYSLSQGDIRQHVGSTSNLSAYNKAQKTEEVALWNNNIFSGMPAYVAGVSVPKPILDWLHGLYVLGLDHPIWVLFTAMLSCYILLLCLGVRLWLAVVLAVSYAFCSYMLIGLGAGHNSRVGAVSFIPLILAGVVLVQRYLGNRQTLWLLVLGLVLGGLGVAFQLQFNHVQITYYTLIVVVVFFIAQVIEQLRERSALWRVFAIRWGALLGIALLGFATYYGTFSLLRSYSQYSIRGARILVDETEATDGLDHSYAFSYSNGILEPLTLLVPRIFGGASIEALSDQSASSQALEQRRVPVEQRRQVLTNIPMYFGDQPITSPYYAGILLCFGFVLACFLLKGNRKYPWLVLFVLAIIMSWGRNFAVFNDLLFNYLPAYNKFRSVTFVLVVAILAMVVLAGQAVEAACKDRTSAAVRRSFLQALYVLGGLLGFCWLVSFFLSFEGVKDANFGMPEWLLEAIRADRARLYRLDTLRGLFFLILIAGVGWGFYKQKLSVLAAFVLLLGINLWDLIGVDTRYFSHEKIFPKTQNAYAFPLRLVDKQIKQDTTNHYRVANLNNPFNETYTSAHHRSIGGYHGAKLRRYQDLIDQVLSYELRAVTQYTKQQQAPGGTPALNMLDVKYFIVDDSRAIRNTAACGAAWLVKEALLVGNPQDEINALRTLQSRHQAVIDTNQVAWTSTMTNTMKQQTFSQQGQVTLIKYTPNRIQYQVNILADTLNTVPDAQALVLFSEIAYPDWEATIDGKPVEWLRVNYLLRALALKEGQHQITFSLPINKYLFAKRTTEVSSIILLSFVLLALGYVSFSVVRRW